MDKIKKREYWNHLIREWETSGKSKKAYCRENDLSYWNFICWNGKLANKLENEQPLVRITAEAPQSIKHTHHEIDIILNDNLKIRIHNSYDSALLKKLLTDLGRLP